MSVIEVVLLIVTIALLLAVIVLLASVTTVKKRLARMERRYSRFMRGKDMRGMEEMVVQRFAEIDSLKKGTKMVADNLAAIGEMGEMSFQKVGIVKYDAFEDTGGNMSFALALLTKRNNGFILNSVHGKEGSYTYLKEIIKGESYVALGKEEQEALDKAKNQDNFME